MTSNDRTVPHMCVTYAYGYDYRLLRLRLILYLPMAPSSNILPSCSPVKVLVLGHSFVRRLRVHLSAINQTNLNLCPTGHVVSYFGLGGMRFPAFLRNLYHACSAGYHFVVLDFSSNDLAMGCPAELLVDQVLAVAETLLSRYCVIQVVLCEILYRSVGRYPLPLAFNDEAHAYNVALRARVEGSCQLHFLHHQGLVANWQQYLADGTHLNMAGMVRYVKSIRRAIIRYSSRHLMYGCDRCLC